MFSEQELLFFIEVRSGLVVTRSSYNYSKYELIFLNATFYSFLLFHNCFTVYRMAGSIVTTYNRHVWLTLFIFYIMAEMFNSFLLSSLNKN